MALIEFDGVGLPDPDMAGVFGADIDETFEELYCQHVAYVRNIARASTLTHADAEDVTAEVFAGLLIAMRNGRGPVEEARPYLRASVRHEVARAQTRGGRHRLVETDPEHFESVVGEEPGRSVEEMSAERATIVSAFKRLSERHQLVLLAIEVHGKSHADVAHQLEMSVGAVTALAKRARDAFALAYLDAHLGGATGECGAVRRNLAAVVRGTETPRRRRRAYEHLQQCESCDHIHRHLTDVNKMLRSLPAGVLAASTGLAGGGASGMFAGLKSFLGIGGGGGGAQGASTTASGGGLAGLGASGAAGIQQVATVATFALSAVVITGEAMIAVPEQKVEAAAAVVPPPESGMRADATQATPTRPPRSTVESSPAEFTFDELSPKTVEKKPTRPTTPDKPATPASAGSARLGAVASITDDHVVPAPATEPASDTPPPPADDESTVVGPADPVESSPPTGNQPSDDGTGPATSTPPESTSPETAPPPSDNGAIEDVTEGLDDTVGQVTDTGGTVVTGITDGGAQAIDDLSDSVDDVLEAAGLPPLTGQVVDPLTGTVRDVGDVLDDGLDLVDVTVDDTTDVVDGLLGTDGVVDVQRLVDELLGGQ